MLSSVSAACQCSGIDLLEKMDFSRNSLSPRPALTLDIKFVTIPSCLCYITKEACLFPLVLPSSSFLDYESIRALDIALPWSACVCIVLSVLFCLQDIHNTLFTSGC